MKKLLFLFLLLPLLARAQVAQGGNAVIPSAVTPGSGGGGSGTVTSFSAAALSPLFTTSVATATTTPALTFSLSTAGANTIYGNDTGSTGSPAFSGVSAYLDDAFGSTQGDILYRDTAAWKVLGPGTSGYFLETQGGSANPTWAAGGGSGTVTHNGNIATGYMVIGGTNGTTDVKTDSAIQSDGAGTITGVVSLQAATVAITNGNGIHGDTTAGHTWLGQFEYTTTPALETFLTVTNGTTPTAVLANSTHGTVTWNGVKIGDAYGGTNLDTSASTGVPQIASGTWSVSTTLPSSLTIPSATLTAPALGTPASGTLTNCTFPTLNQNTTGTAGGLSGTPAITVSSVNGNTFTTGTYTLTGTAGKTLDFTNTLTLSGTDSTTMTFPSSSDTVATLAATQTLTNKRITARVNTTTSSATPAINTDTTDMFTITALAANITSMTSGLSGTPNNGDQLLIRIIDNGTSRTIAWGTSFESIAGGGTLPTATVISTYLYVLLVWNSTASKWDCVSST